MCHYECYPKSGFPHRMAAPPTRCGFFADETIRRIPCQHPPECRSRDLNECGRVARRAKRKLAARTTLGWGRPAGPSPGWGSRSTRLAPTAMPTGFLPPPPSNHARAPLETRAKFAKFANSAHFRVFVIFPNDFTTNSFRPTISENRNNLPRAQMTTTRACAIIAAIAKTPPQGPPSNPPHDTLESNPFYSEISPRQQVQKHPLTPTRFIP
jgi:hypothetical protein